MSSTRNPKTLPEWEELDYFNRPRRLKALWKPVLLGTLAVGVVGMVAIAALQKKVAPRLATAYQAGPLSSAHAMFNNNCGICHVEAFKTWDRLWQFNSTIQSVPDKTCIECHAGPIHNTKQVRSESCVSCHREHHGRARLDRVADAHCTSCHGNLSAAVKGGDAVLYENVASFASHPAFKERWEGAPKDPGTVAFNHKVHLALDDPATQKPLLCNKCHVPDVAGQAMLPIRYEDHCKGCHPLTVSLPVAGAAADTKRALAEFSRTPAPHQAPEMVRAALRDRLTLLIQNHPEFLKGESGSGGPPRPIPGSRVSRPEVVSKEEYEWVGQQLIKVEGPLLDSKAAGCAKCHQRIETAGGKAGELPQFARPHINERTFPDIGASSRWYPHSRFRHDSHRMLDCTQCHVGAPNSERTSEVLLPDITNCRQCHDSRPGASARSDCIECHSYHPAAGKKEFHGKLSVEQVLGASGPATPREKE